MENSKDKILKEALEKYASENFIPSYKINGLMNEADEVKEKILSLSDSEKQLLLKSVNRDELAHLKNILNGVVKNEQSGQ